MSYFVIQCSEDGDVSVYELTKQELDEKFVDEETPPYKGWSWGKQKWASSVPDYDIQCWGRDGIIIKGEIVVPEAVDVVQQWEVP